MIISYLCSNPHLLFIFLFFPVFLLFSVFLLLLCDLKEISNKFLLLVTTKSV